MLEPRVLLGIIWRMGIPGASRQGNVVTANRYTVSGTTAGTFPPVPPNTLNWAPPPFDVADLQYATLAEPMVNFPLTVLP